MVEFLNVGACVCVNGYMYANSVLHMVVYTIARVIIKCVKGEHISIHMHLLIHRYLASLYIANAFIPVGLAVVF